MNDSNPNATGDTKSSGTDPNKTPPMQKPAIDPLRSILDRLRKIEAPDPKKVTTSIYELFKRLLTTLRRLLKIGDDRAKLP